MDEKQGVQHVEVPLNHHHGHGRNPDHATEPLLGDYGTLRGARTQSEAVAPTFDTVPGSTQGGLRLRSQSTLSSTQPSTHDLNPMERFWNFMREPHFVEEQQDEDAIRMETTRDDIDDLSSEDLEEREERRMRGGFEGLDYDVPQNKLYREEHNRVDNKVNRNVNTVKWILFAVIGIGTGSVAYLLNEAVEYFSRKKFDAIRDLLEERRHASAYGVYLAITLGYVLIATILVAYVEPVAGGSGIPEIKAYLNGTNYLRLLRLKTLFSKCVGVVFAVAGGLAIGKEGPLVHTGAIIGANITHMTGLRRLVKKGSKLHQWVHQFRNDKDKRDFVSGGAAAGVSAAFGAPVGGILFSLEEASSFWSVDLTWKCFLCSMLGTFFLHVWNVVKGSESFSGLISFGPPVDMPYKLWETIPFVILALFGGLQGAAFNWINYKICKWRRTHLWGKPLLRMIEALLVAFITATLSFWPPFIHGVGQCVKNSESKTQQFFTTGLYFGCPHGYHNSMAAMTVLTWESSIKAFFHTEADYAWQSLLAFAVIIFFLAVITYGIAVPSGLFVPCILMGCAYGRLFGQGMEYLFPDYGIEPQTYAIIGATASLGGVARMTISLTVIVLETTDGVKLIMPIMMTLMISKWVGDQFNISLYDLHIELKCMPFVESAPSTNMNHKVARTVMQKPVVCLTQIVKVRELLKVILHSQHHGFPVVTGKTHKFVGIILKNQLVVLIQHHMQGTKPTSTDFATSLQSQHKLLDLRSAPNRLDERDYDVDIDLRPYYNPVPISVQEQCPLSKIYVLFRSLGLRHLPVVNMNNEVKGIITRKELASHFDQDLV